MKDESDRGLTHEPGDVGDWSSLRYFAGGQETLPLLVAVLGVAGAGQFHDRGDLGGACGAE